MQREGLIYYLLTIFILISSGLYGQDNSIGMSAESGILFGKGENLPFWVQSGNYGLIPNQKNQIYGKISAKKEISKDNTFDYGYGLSVVGQGNVDSDFYMEEWYGNLSYQFLQFTVGTQRRILRTYNHELGSGDIIWSGNSRPFPELVLFTKEFVSIPYTSDWVKFNAGISHGWMEGNSEIENPLLHSKWFSLRSGDSFPLQLEAGFYHFAQWGGRSEKYGSLPSDLKAFLHVFKADGGDYSALQNESINALGNHIGSYHLCLNYNNPDYSISLSWQSLFEDKSGAEWDNHPDGLYTLSYVSRKEKSFVRGICFEVMATDNQSGPVVRDTVNGIPYTGNDNYFNHGIYTMGWSQYGRCLGTPLISSPFYSPGSYGTKNNRVRAIHFGGNAGIKKSSVNLLLTKVWSMGTYEDEISTVKSDIFFLLSFTQRDLIFKESEVSLTFSMDKGEYYGTSVAMMIGIVKNWSLKKNNFFKQCLENK